MTTDDSHTAHTTNTACQIKYQLIQMSEPSPAQMSGSFNYDIKVELYRAVFLPIRLHPRLVEALDLRERSAVIGGHMLSPR